jgi:hypothetical protein
MTNDYCRNFTVPSEMFANSEIAIYSKDVGKKKESFESWNVEGFDTLWSCISRFVEDIRYSEPQHITPQT